MSYLREPSPLAPAMTAPITRRTLQAPIGAAGRGLHSGAEVNLRLVPAAAETGIVFHRTDLDVKIPARYDAVADTRLCTLIAQGQARVGTIEHLMAALSAAGIDDLVVEVDAPELPVFDGSAAPFLFLIESAGIALQAGRRPQVQVLRPVRVEHEGAFAELRPHQPGGQGFDISLSIAFSAAAIGAQAYHFQLSAAGFADEIATARTFAMAGEIEALRQAGLARGGSLANAVVVDGARILNPEGLRFNDEFVRHKLLDVIGDLALAGAPIWGRFLGNRTGHALNNRLLRTLFADQANYRLAAPAAREPERSAA